MRPVCEDTAEPDSGGQDGDRRAETSETPEDKGRMKGMLKRPRLTKSVSLLPHPRQVTSTLHLQVLPQKHKNDTTYTICRPERGGTLGRRDNIPPSVPFPCLRQPPHFQPDYIPPLVRQGQYIPPPLHTFPMLYAPLQAPNASCTHLQTLTAQPCQCYYCMYFPHTHWSHYSSTQLPW